MRSPRPHHAIVVAAILLDVGACGNGDDNSVPAPAAPISDAGSDATKNDASHAGDATLAMDVGADASTEAETESAAPPTTTGVAATPVASLRVANWSGDAPAVDFCIAPHGTTAFQGPLLANQAAAIDQAGVIDAGSGALGFPGVSSYFVVKPGQYDARLVAGGSGDCSVKVIDDRTDLPPLKVGGAATLALLGETHPASGGAGSVALRLSWFPDDTAAPTWVALRFINAAPNLPQVNVSKGIGAAVTPQFSSIPFGTAGTLVEAQQAVAADASQPTVDVNGYDILTMVTPATGVALPPLSAATFDVVFGSADAGPPVVVSNPISSDVGAVLTIAILPATPSAGPDSGSAAMLLECIDNAGTAGLGGNCSVISP
jgi:hypothetical protein